MKRHLLGLVVFSALLGGQAGCDDDKPRTRDAAPGGEDTGGTGGSPFGTGGTGGSTGGTGGTRTGGTGGGGTGGMGGAPLDASSPDARTDGGALDTASVDLGTAGDLARDLAADAAVDVAVPTPDAAVDTAVLTPDVAPDLARDVAPDLAPDLAPDTSPDVAPDAMAFMSFSPCTQMSSYLASTTPPRTVTFNINDGYDPPCLKINRNEQVTFTGTSGATFAAHPLVARDPAVGTMPSPFPAFTSGSQSGTTKQFAFPNSGFFPYVCHTHSFMTGVIWVE